MMTESPVVNSWIERAVAESLVKDRRGSLLEVLTTQFGSVPSDVLATIQQQPSLEMLRDWLHEACAAKTLEEFIAILRR